ncbi:MAG: SIMPL domain-containing protein [Chloroflexi bacterium]|nr:SIMPL domain-containing protein [Chloroflexota bacterium]
MPNRMIIGIAALLLTVAAALGTLFAVTPQLTPSIAEANQPANANAQVAADVNTGIMVSGEGKVNVKPNIAIANIGVDITTASLSDATNQANTKMAAVIEKLKSLGIAEKDIQTTSYNLYPITQQPRTPDGSGTPTITGYRVSNQVRVTIRKIDDLGKILEQAVSAGANSIYGVSFGVDDLAPYQQQARAAAIKDAQDKAAQLAKSANIQLGPVLAISEGTQGPGPVFATNARLSLAQGGEVPVQTGETQIIVNVSVRFGIK